MRICVVGTGYVGSVVAACLANKGHKVVGIDVDEEKVRALNKGRAVVFEPGLEELLRRGLEGGRLLFSSDFRKASGASLVFVCVNTPPLGREEFDLSPLEEAVRKLSLLPSPPRAVVIKSTVPVGTTRRLEGMVRDRGRGTRLKFASNPEFLREGKAVEDFLRPLRIVVGTEHREVASLLKGLYADFGAPFILTTPEAAEIIKLAANAFLSTRISFINEIAKVCEHYGVDVEEVAGAIGLDPRIGQHYLKAGIGFGGACLPKDLSMLARAGEVCGEEMPLLRAVESVNQLQPFRAVQKLKKALKGIEGKTIAILGLAFKPGTDDTRESPALKVCSLLLREGARLKVHDPALKGRVREVLPEAEDCPSPEEAWKEADAIALLTDWPEYRKVNFRKASKQMRGKVVFDGRLLFDPDEVRKAGLEYVGLGRGEGG